MNIINADGEYEILPGTQTPKQSDHPVYKARIELALGAGTWVCAPDKGNSLGRFARVRQTEEKIQEFQKEMSFYLKKYGPQVTESMTQRGAVSFDLKVAKDALDV